MRMNIMFGLNHVETDEQNSEAERILTDLNVKISCGKPLEVGDTIILRDINGNRIGVADVFKD